MKKQLILTTLFLSNLPLFAHQFSGNGAKTDIEINKKSDTYKLNIKEKTDDDGDFAGDVDLEFDLGLGDSLFPGAEKELVDKLNKVFNPVINELKVIQAENIARLNTDALNGGGNKLNNAFLTFIGLDEGRIQKIMKYTKCNKDQQKSEHGKICTVLEDYSSPAIGIFAKIQNKIKAKMNEVRSSYRTNISAKMNEYVQKVRKKQNTIFDKYPMLKKGFKADYQSDVAKKLRKAMYEGCTNLGAGQNDPSVTKSVNALCSTMSGTPLYKSVFTELSKIEGMEAIPDKMNMYFKAKVKVNSDMCKLMENLNSNDPELRKKAQEEMREKLKQLFEKLKEEVLKIIIVEVIKRMGILTLMNQIIDAPMCFVIATIQSAKAAKAARKSSGIDTDGFTNTMSDIFDSFKEASSSLFGKGNNQASKVIKDCFDKKEMKTSGSDKDTSTQVDLGLTDNGVSWWVPFTEIVMHTGTPFSMPQISAKYAGNLATTEDKDRFETCVAQGKSEVWKKAFKDCMDGKGEVKFSLSFKLLPEIQKLSLEKWQEKKLQCVFDKEVFNKPVINEKGDEILIDLAAWENKLPNLMSSLQDPRNINRKKVPNLFVLQQKIQMMGIDSINVANYKNRMSDFYEKEYNGLFLKKETPELRPVTIFDDGLCFISYSKEDGKTLLELENKMGGILDWPSGKTVTQCYKPKGYDNCSFGGHVTDSNYQELDATNAALLGWNMNCERVTGQDSYGNPITDSTKTATFRAFPGLNNYCHNLSVAINDQLSDMERNYIRTSGGKIKVCSDKPNTSCKKNTDCGEDGGDCITKFYVQDSTDSTLKGYQMAIANFYKCVEYHEKIIKEDIETLGKDDLSIMALLSNNSIKEKFIGDLFLVKFGLVTFEEFRDNILLYSEYKRLFDLKMNIDPEGNFIKDMCMNLKEPENALIPSPDYRICKEYKVLKMESIKREAVDSQYKRKFETDSEKATWKLKIKKERKELRKKYCPDCV